MHPWTVWEDLWSGVGLGEGIVGSSFCPRFSTGVWGGVAHWRFDCVREKRACL